MTLTTSDPKGAEAREAARASRVVVLDVLRGAAMVLMALDHVRVYSGLPAGGPTPGIFFTRWITHFVAPAFAFLAGSAAYLHGKQLGERSALARYLVTRGLILVLLELTFIRLAWTFNLDFGTYLLAGVIWMLGWCMVLLAALIWLPTKVVAVFALLAIFAQSAVTLPCELVPESARSAIDWIWSFLYVGGEVPLGAGGPTIAVLYTLVPWIGVMAAGYAFGAIAQRPPDERRRACLALGGTAIVLFVALRFLDGYGDQRPWSEARPGSPPALLRFLNTSKYPASPLFLLMTLGPLIALVPLVEGARGRVARILSVFGRVPLFYYLLHIPLIHVAAIAISLLRTGSVEPWLFANHPMWAPPPPEGYTWSLALLYAVFALVVVALYFPSRWYARVKARRPRSWMRYL